MIGEGEKEKLRFFLCVRGYTVVNDMYKAAEKYIVRCANHPAVSSDFAIFYCQLVVKRVL